MKPATVMLLVALALFLYCLQILGLWHGFPTLR